MPLTILLPLVVFGIAGIVLMIRLLHPTPPLLFDTVEEVQRLWDHRNHNAKARQTHINPDRTCALVETDAGVGLVWSFGVDPVTRLLSDPFEVSETPAGLRLETGDFTAPTIDIALTSDEDRAKWRALLGGTRT